MTAQSDLWAAVVVSYDNDGLVSLSNIRSRAGQTINTTRGEDAALGVINLWSIYAQEDYDAADSTHVEVAKRGTIAMLWERGGASSAIAKVEWDEVFSADGLIAKVRRTGARGRQGPSSNSGVSQKSELTSTGRRIRPWSDPASLPIHSVLPRRTIAED